MPIPTAAVPVHCGPMPLSTFGAYMESENAYSRHLQANKPWMLFPDRDEPI